MLDDMKYMHGKNERFKKFFNQQLRKIVEKTELFPSEKHFLCFFHSIQIWLGVRLSSVNK